MNNVKDIWAQVRPESLSYNSLFFLFFLATGLAVISLSRSQKARRNWLLVMNLIFYTWSGWSTLLLVAVTGGTVWVSAYKIGQIYKDYEHQLGETGGAVS